VWRRASITALAGGCVLPLASAHAAAPARVGPGPVATHVERGAYAVSIGLAANAPGSDNVLRVVVTRGGRPVAVRVRATLVMADMAMPAVLPRMRTVAARSVSQRFPLWMAGRWRVTLAVTPRHAKAFRVELIDTVG